MSEGTTSVRRPCICEIPGSFTMTVVEFPPGYLVYQCARCGRVLKVQEVRRP